ncbi:unnamed protein product [Effrenium voratum]|uniref:Uncharacterized protein n=1 Tax=Effrenium voratum TaxID=2562239 RepID=A0AA36N7T7_9DINO|nr:unnamed protein product [Effrenium voratum]
MECPWPSSTSRTEGRYERGDMGLAAFAVPHDDSCPFETAVIPPSFMETILPLGIATTRTFVGFPTRVQKLLVSSTATFAARRLFVIAFVPNGAEGNFCFFDGDPPAASRDTELLGPSDFPCMGCSRQRAATEAQPSTEPTECDLEMGLAPPTPSDADPEDEAEESECWGESEEESEDEDEEEPRVSNDCRDGLILQAATMGLRIRHCTAPEVHAEAGRVALARLDKSGEQGHALDESDAASLLDPEVMVAAVKIIGGLMMSKICHGKGHRGMAFAGVLISGLGALQRSGGGQAAWSAARRAALAEGAQFVLLQPLDSCARRLTHQRLTAQLCQKITDNGADIEVADLIAVLQECAVVVGARIRAFDSEVLNAQVGSREANPAGLLSAQAWD